jgi:hypothetical protein
MKMPNQFGEPWIPNKCKQLGHFPCAIDRCDYKEKDLTFIGAFADSGDRDRAVACVNLLAEHKNLDEVVVVRKVLYEKLQECYAVYGNALDKIEAAIQECDRRLDNENTTPDPPPAGSVSGDAFDGLGYR